MSIGGLLGPTCQESRIVSSEMGSLVFRGEVREEGRYIGDERYVLCVSRPQISSLHCSRRRRDRTEIPRRYRHLLLDALPF